MNKNISELKICDDRMFCYIMAKHPDITRRVLETILGIQIRSMKVVNAQKVLNYEPDVKAVRLDINGESSDDRSLQYGNGREIKKEYAGDSADTFKILFQQSDNLKVPGRHKI